MPRYINPFCDVGFKRIFGQEYSKPLLISFLNNLLKGEKEITDLTFLDKEQPGICEDDRSLIYDIYCTTVDGEKIIVEMQQAPQPNFKKRSIYYISQAISRQGEQGTKWQYNIKAVYLVAILGFEIPEIGNKFRADVTLMDMETHELFSTDVRMIYLQLPLFTKTEEECETDFDKWIYALKNMEQLITNLPWAGQDSVFAQLATIADISSLTKEDRVRYDSSIKKFRDTSNVMEGAKEEGFEKGRAEGIEKPFSKILSVFICLLAVLCGIQTSHHIWIQRKILCDRPVVLRYPESACSVLRIVHRQISKITIHVLRFTM